MLDVGIELCATCIPSEHTSDQATSPGENKLCAGDENKLFTGGNKLYADDDKLCAGENKLCADKNKLCLGENKLCAGQAVCR